MRDHVIRFDPDTVTSTVVSVSITRLSTSLKCRECVGLALAITVFSIRRDFRDHQDSFLL